MVRLRVRGVLVALVLASASLAGCLELSAARIPDKLLEGPGGNGWEKNLTASMREPSGGATEKRQLLVYEDRRSEEGYAGQLAVTTMRTLFQPSGEGIRETLQERIRADAESKGVTIEGNARTGTRTLANGEESSWFVYDGSVATSGFFARAAKVKIFGEVFQCYQEKTLVATVGIAQVTDVRSIGGVPLPADDDPTTWREMVADPAGTVEAIRGSDGLAWNVAC